MVGVNLKCQKYRRHDAAPQVFATVGEHKSRYGRWYISQCHHLPYMPRSNDDEEIAGECPYHGTECRQALAEVEGTQQDIKSQHGCEKVPYVFRQIKVVYIFKCTQ